MMGCFAEAINYLPPSCRRAIAARVYWVLLLAFISTNTNVSWCQEVTGAIQGIVLDARNHVPIRHVLVRLSPGPFTTLTKNTGTFSLTDLPPGQYEIQFVKDGYLAAIFMHQQIEAGKINKLWVELVPHHGLSGDVIQIGGIEIVANKELLPDKPETATLIHSSDLEHIQATSLADALDLVPGIELRNQPHLKAPRTAQLRDPRPADLFSAFGTKIIIDGVPYTNNSNLQGPLLSGVYTGTGNGVDLREIPADHIETIEVIRGVAPAEYGDLVTGLIKVTTRASTKPGQRFKAKNNPDTKELNWDGTVRLGQITANYNLNWAYSQRDLRRDNDNTQRLAAQLKVVGRSADHKRSSQSLFSYSKLIEAVRQNPQDPDALESINRGFRFTFSNQTSLPIASQHGILSNLFINYRRHDSYKQYRIVADNRVVSSLMSPGTTVGFKPDHSYLFQCTTLGDELSFGHDIHWRWDFFIGHWFHAVKLGHQFQFDENFGEGRRFDLLHPDRIGNRPRRFDAIPGLFQQAFYFNDQLTGRLGKEFTLDLGFRLERYTSDRWPHIRFFRSNHGIFLNPRLNLAYFLANKTQLRLAYGQFSKAPALSYSFPDPTYLDVLDVTPRMNEKDTLLIRDSLITTYVFEGANPKLKGYRERKLELSWDQQIAGIGISLTGFHSRRYAEPDLEQIPVLYFKYLRLSADDLKGQAVLDTLISHYLTNINAGWAKFNGIELVVRSRRMPKLNLDGSAMVSYHHVTNGSTASFWGTPFADFTIPKYRQPVFSTQKLLLTYQVNYISPVLGIWISLLAQQVPFHQTQRRSYADSLAIAYYDGLSGQTIDIPESARDDPGYERYRLSKVPHSDRAHRFPSKWLINARVSKSLFSGAELSLYVNNLFNDRAYYRDPYDPERYLPGNPEIFYGIEFSMVIDHLLKRRP